MPKLPRPVPNEREVAEDRQVSVQRSRADCQDTAVTGGWPASTPGQTVVTVAPSPRKAAEQSRSGRSSASASPPREGSPTAASPDKRRDRVPGPGHHSDQECARETSMTRRSTTRLPWPGARAGMRGSRGCRAARARAARSPAPAARPASPARGRRRCLPSSCRTRTVASGISTTGPAAADEPAMAEVDREAARPWPSALPSRSSGGGRPGRSPPRLEKAVQAFGMARDLHQPERRVEQERRHDASPDQVKPPQPIREMRDAPEDPQADAAHHQPAKVAARSSVAGERTCAGSGSSTAGRSAAPGPASRHRNRSAAPRARAAAPAGPARARAEACPAPAPGTPAA